MKNHRKKYTFICFGKKLHSKMRKYDSTEVKIKLKELTADYKEKNLGEKL